jgi:hypothetical protein
MFVMWQYMKATGLASQYVVDASQLHALLGVLHQRAVADSYPHAVILSPGNGNRQTAHGLENGPGPSVPVTGPQPQLTLVLGTDYTPLLWNDNVPAARQISVGPRAVTQPEPQDYFHYYAAGREQAVPESSLIGRDYAWLAAQMFVTSGGHRPATITWRTRMLL